MDTEKLVANVAKTLTNSLNEMNLLPTSQKPLFENYCNLKIAITDFPEGFIKEDDTYFISAALFNKSIYFVELILFFLMLQEWELEKNIFKIINSYELNEHIPKKLSIIEIKEINNFFNLGSSITLSHEVIENLYGNVFVFKNFWYPMYPNTPIEAKASICPIFENAYLSIEEFIFDFDHEKFINSIANGNLLSDIIEVYLQKEMPNELYELLVVFSKLSSVQLHGKIVTESIFRALVRDMNSLLYLVSKKSS